ncbi:MAG TPA: general stress protein [Bacillota bacterium]
MAKIVLGTFGDRQSAEHAAERLQQAGVDRGDISIVAKDDRRGGQGREGEGGAQMSQAQDGAWWGAGLGAGAGLLASAGALAVPGIGPLLAAGPLAAALSGAVTGGLAGGLIDWGLPEESGRRYEEEVKRGRVLCACRCDEDRVDRVEAALKETGADHVEVHDSRN